MAYKTCPDCGSRIFEHGCVNCNEMDYISMQGAYDYDTPKIQTLPVAPQVTAMEKLNLVADIRKNANTYTVMGSCILQAIADNTPAIKILEFVQSQAKDNPNAMAKVIGEELTNNIINLIL